MQKKFTVEALEQLINASPVGMFIVDKDRNMLFANKSYAKMFGYTLDEIANVNTKIFHVSEESYNRFAKIAFDAASKGEPVSTEFQAKKKDGTIFWVHISGEILKDHDEILWTMIDITPLKETQKNLENTNYNLQEYLKVIDKIGIGIFIVDEDYTIRYMNNTMKEWFGDQEGKVCYASVANLDTPCGYCKLAEVIHDNEKVVYEPTTPDGQSFEIVATPIHNLDGTISKMEVIRNVTDQKDAEKKLLEQRELLHHQAHHDILTSLPNRTYFNTKLDAALKKAHQNNTKVALFFIDLDHFKEINDSLGHEAGDKVLKITTKKLLKIIRENDFLSRFGGDEFTLIIDNLKDCEEASVLAKRILEILKEPIVLDGNKMYLSSSIGISIYPDDGVDAQDLLKYADSAMYKAKAEGRNNFQFYSAEMTKMAFERVVMESSLRSALENEEFVVYYQPQVDAKTAKLIGMEALVRWEHPTMGMIPPSKFIPLAESTGLIVELDRFVMQEGMQQMSRWYNMGYNPGKLAMNLTVKHLQRSDFIATFTKMMEQTQCAAEWIELEVTESQIMTKPQEAIKILNQISEMGIKLAIDDFGTGYSSLAYLKKLPLDKLKIDQSFVKELPYDEDDVAIAKAVIALAKSLNLEIIAEGVETKEQKNFLLENGCSHIQGYYYSKPINAKALEVILKDNS